MHEARKKLVGFSCEYDRLWLLHTPMGTLAITEYNEELTGFDPELGKFDPKIFRYGGNAYYILGTLAREQGWIIEGVEDRR